MKLRKWDRGINYDYLFSKLLNMYNQFLTLFSNLPTDKMIAKRFLYTSIALIQLRNGLRLSEAVEAIIHFSKTGERKFKIMPKKNNNERWVIILDFILQRDIQNALTFVQDIKKLTQNYRMWLKNVVGINSHSLRYAFIRKMLDKGLNSTQIALILGHRKLETTYEYEKTYNSLRLLEDL